MDDLIAYQDPHLCVVNKPSGLASQGGRGLDDHLECRLDNMDIKARLVHRLDRGTSGVMVVAKTKPVAAFLSDQFAKRRAHKIYVATVHGVPNPLSGTIDAPLQQTKNDAGRVIMAADQHGRAAKTVYRTLAKTDHYAVVECRPKTGRMHQIRAHMAHIGCPLVGDDLYDGALPAQPGRLQLHSYQITLDHPDGGQLRATVPPPADMAVFWQQNDMTISPLATTAKVVYPHIHNG